MTKLPDTDTLRDALGTNAQTVGDAEPQKIDQTRTGEKGNCFSASLAMMIGIDISEVPNFFDAGGADADWWEAARVWLAGYNLGCITMSSWDHHVHKTRGFLLVGGDTSRGLPHSVIFKDGKLWHDPHPSHEGLSKIDSIDILYPLNPLLPIGKSALSAQTGNTPDLRSYLIQLGRPHMATAFRGEKATDEQVCYEIGKSLVLLELGQLEEVTDIDGDMERHPVGNTPPVREVEVFEALDYVSLYVGVHLAKHDNPQDRNALQRRFDLLRRAYASQKTTSDTRTVEKPSAMREALLKAKTICENVTGKTAYHLEMELEDLHEIVEAALGTTETEGQ